MANEVHGVPSECSALLEGTKVDGQVHPFIFNIHDDEFAAVEGTSGCRIVSIPLRFKVAWHSRRPYPVVLKPLTVDLVLNILLVIRPLCMQLQSFNGAHLRLSNHAVEDRLKSGEWVFFAEIPAHSHALPFKEVFGCPELRGVIALPTDLNDARARHVVLEHQKFFLHHFDFFGTSEIDKEAF